MRWRSAAVVPAVVLALAAGLLPAASQASATSTVSISASKVFETDTGNTRTAAMPGGGYLAVHSFGTLSMVGPDGRTLWQRDTARLDQDWGVQWQNPAAYVNAPQVPWGANPVNPLQFAGGVAGLINDVTPYAIGELGGSRSPDVAVAEVVGTSLLGESSCEFCAWPFNVPGSSVHLGTFVSVLDGRTGRMLFHEVEPGYVTQLAITGGRLIVGDETGDPLRQGGIGAWGSASNVSALSFTPSGAGLDIFGKAFPEQTFDVGIAEQHADVELLLVIGAKNSSNSNRLHENSLETGVRSRLVADSGELRSEWLDNVKSVGVIAGAFAPEALVGGVIWLRWLGPVEVSTLDGPDETIEFRLPPELASVSSLPRLPTALARPRIIQCRA